MSISNQPETAPALVSIRDAGFGGGLSGGLSAAALAISAPMGLLLPGVLCGAALAVYIWNSGTPRSVGAVIALSPFILGKSWTILFLTSPIVPNMAYADERLALTAAGAIGASIISFGFLSLLHPSVSPVRLALKVAAYTFVGAALARAGRSSTCTTVPLTIGDGDCSPLADWNGQPCWPFSVSREPAVTGND